MKKIFVIAAVAVLFAGVIFPTHAAELKFGVVDFAKCQRYYYKTHSRQVEFQKKREKESAALQEMQNQIKELLDMQRNAQKELQDPMFSDTRKKEILKEAQERQSRILALQRKLLDQEAQVKRKLDAMVDEIQKELTGDIRRVIEEVSKTKGLQMVFNKSFGFNGIPALAYVEDSTIIEDITDAVIEKLNLTAPSDYTVPDEAIVPAG